MRAVIRELLYCFICICICIICKFGMLLSHESSVSGSKICSRHQSRNESLSFAAGSNLRDLTITEQFLTFFLRTCNDCNHSLFLWQQFKEPDNNIANRCGILELYTVATAIIQVIHMSPAQKLTRTLWRQ
jgi:hypothetical protein